MFKLYRTFPLCLAFSLVASCGGLSTVEMTPEQTVSAPHTLDGELAIGIVTGGREPTFGGPQMINNELFSTVLFDAVGNSGVFESVRKQVGPTTDLILNANISRQTQEVFGGLGYHGIFNVEYEFLDAQSREPVWRLSIPASHRVTFGQAFTGAARTTKAREGSVRNNLAAFNRALNPWKAAASSSVAIITKFQASGSDLDDRDANGNTPLMIAAYNGKTEVVDYLLQQEVAIDAQSEQGSTALLAALGGGRVAIAKSLLTQGADPHLVNNQGETALMLGAGVPSAELVTRLIDAGLDPDAKSRAGLNAVIFAALRGDVDTMNVLFSHGAKPVQVSGDVDIAVAVGRAVESYAAWMPDAERAGQYAIAARSYKQALVQLSDAENSVLKNIADDQARERSAAASAEFSQALMELGLQFQARQNARQLREVQALGIANRTGTGTQGYFSALRELERSPDLSLMRYPDVAFSRNRFDALAGDSQLRRELNQIQSLQAEVAERIAYCEEQS